MGKINRPDKLLGVLDLFSESRPLWTPGELMHELGYTRPTLYRYLKSLKDCGLLMSTRGGRLTLGPRVVEMDYLSRRADPLVAACLRHLAQLTDTHPSTALIVRWYGDKMLCVASQSSTPNPVSSYQRGRPMPMARSAIARSIMAFLPKQQLMRLIARNAEDLRGVGLGETAEDVLSVLKRIRRAGVAVAFGEVTPGAIAIAAPILDARYPVASLCLTIPGRYADGGLIERISNEVRAAARLIASEL